MTSKDIIDRYIEFFEGVTPSRLGELHELCAGDVRFIDPFNDLTGVAAMTAVFEKMFEDVASPKFHVHHCAWAPEPPEGGARCYLHWTFTGNPNGGGQALEIEGVSEVLVNGIGKVTSHRDFWDPSTPIYQRVPILGFLVRLVSKRLALG